MTFRRVTTARKRLSTAGAALALLSAVVVTGCGGPRDMTQRATYDASAFTEALAVPPLATSVKDDRGRISFHLDVRAGRHRFGDGEKATAGVNGAYLGPTIRVRTGETVALDVHNGLDEVTTMHWHGLRPPPAMDGGPMTPIAPGQRRTSTWTIDQPAGTSWYHPHPHGQTRQQVGQGIAGMFLVEDGRARPGLPATYGTDDIPLIMQSRDVDGASEDEPVVVNGTYHGVLDVTTELVRLRLLNASTVRTLAVGFGDGRAFHLVGTDADLLRRPVHLDRLTLSPGERADIVVSFRGTDGPALLETNDQDDRSGLVLLRPTAALAASPPLPDVLDDITPLTRDEAVGEREFELRGHSINGRTFDMKRVDFTAKPGSVERWIVTHPGGGHHNFHVHGAHFQVTAVNGAPPPPELSGWKDTIDLPPEQSVELLVRFADHDDPHHTLMYHCHNLAHEDDGMMGQFLLTGSPSTHSGHGHR